MEQCNVRTGYALGARVNYSRTHPRKQLPALHRGHFVGAAQPIHDPTTRVVCGLLRSATQRVLPVAGTHRLLGLLGLAVVVLLVPPIAGLDRHSGEVALGELEHP